jgi:diadenosine tetraphosphatase ApaH/serine/threonine PP2A family protein phosphatase
MKLALLTDLHANRQALEAVWAHAQEQGFDRLVLLGDYVDYGADPVWVLDFVMARVKEGALAVKGNHDDALSGGSDHAMAAHVQATLNWTDQQLSDAHRDFIRALPITLRLGDCLLTHANAHAPQDWGYIHGRLEASRSLYATDARYVFCGHMHDPHLYHASGTGKLGEFIPVPGTPIELSPVRRWLAIPGSVGQPRDGNPAACYALFDTDTATLTFHRVPYDHDAAAASIIAAGLPADLAERLQHGL